MVSPSVPNYHDVQALLLRRRSSPASAENSSFDHVAATVATLIEEVSAKPVHLVGISFLGMIAQIATLARPDLIRSLILIGTASHFP